MRRFFVWMTTLGACFGVSMAAAAPLSLSVVTTYQEWTDPVAARRELFFGLSLEVPWQALLGQVGPGAMARPPAPAPRSAQLVPGAGFVREVVYAALLRRGRVDPRVRLDALGTRARTARVLPELGLRAERTYDESLRLAPTLDDPYRYTQAGGDALRFEARMTWRLNELVFTESEVSLARLRQQADASEGALVEQVLKQYFRWQAARQKQRSKDATPDERLTLWLEEFEAHARLDVLTAGWFSRRVGAVGPVPSPAS